MSAAPPRVGLTQALASTKEMELVIRLRNASTYTNSRLEEPTTDMVRQCDGLCK